VRGVSLSVHEKSMTLLSGGSESGSNLFLRLLGLLETPEEGEIYFHGQPTSGLPAEARADLRNQRFGFVFAQPFLLPSFTVIENVAMPLFKISGVSASEAQQRTEAILAFTDLQHLGEAGMGVLSLADQHRVSLARALVNGPEILVVENIDAGLDGADLLSFGAMIQRASAEFGTTVVIAARAVELARFADRVVEFEGGAICRDSQPVAKEGGAAV
jgi:ABC-type lipoprotein export system ATPase subunit